VIVVPSLGMITASRERQSSLSTVMGVLSSARTLAMSGKRETWVVFRKEGHRILLRTVLGGPAGTESAGNWIALPNGIRAADDEGSLTSQPLPPPVLAIAGGSSSLLGGIGFLPSGKISPMARSGGQLSLEFADRRGDKAGPILLSRTTRLATIP